MPLHTLFFRFCRLDRTVQRNGRINVIYLKNVQGDHFCFVSTLKSGPGLELVTSNVVRCPVHFDNGSTNQITVRPVRPVRH